MVDSQSQLRLRRVGPSSVEIRQGFPSNRLLNAECGHRVFSSRHPPAHSCRPASLQSGEDPQHWAAFLLAFGLRQSQEQSVQLHCKPLLHKRLEERPPDKLLHSIGQRGNTEGRFNYPRGLCVSPQGEIAVADTDNHRVQLFNSSGVFKNCLGRGRGSGAGEMERPCDVAWMPTGNYVVADAGNRRLQIFRPRGNLRMMFHTVQPPCAICCDARHFIIVATVFRQIEIYKKGGKFDMSFNIDATNSSSSPSPSPMSLAADTRVIILCDTANRCVMGFNYSGQPVLQFTPQASVDGGLASVPAGIDFFGADRLVVGDSLNHTVGVYSLTGQLHGLALTPTDDLGCVQAVRVNAAAGQLIATEFAANGLHCLKIFQLAADPASSKRPNVNKDTATPIPKAHFSSERVVV